MYEQRLKTNLPQVEGRIADALERSGRGGHVRLVAVTKGHAAGAVVAAHAAGLRVVGENRVQELDEKRAAVPPEVELEWHLIGHLQRNKVRRAMELFDLIHSIDSLRLAQELAK
jgi:PLP dependent protein